MTRTSSVVTLEVAKQGAIYHGLATLLNQPSPMMQRGEDRLLPAGAGSPYGSRGAFTGSRYSDLHSPSSHDGDSEEGRLEQGASDS